MKLAVGFVTYQETSAKYLADFLPSLAAALKFLDPADFQIYAFDNSNPGDLSNSRILATYKNIKYLRQDHNLGFAAAYNVLIREALKDAADYFLVINPDTIMDPETIELLAAALDRDGSLGSAAPKILRWDFAGKLRTKTIDSLGLVLRTGLQFRDLGQGMEDDGKAKSTSILGPSGAAGLFRLSALEKVAITPFGQAAQYFDERFFMYKEDCDLAYRLFLAGYNSCLVPEALVYHDRTTAVSGRGARAFWRDRQSKSRQIKTWSFRNQHLIFLKYWRKQDFVNKIVISVRIFSMFIFLLILEQYLLKEYPQIARLARG
jgi:N-acetylglucosaminyl-diphospho-decaprenol L-rhamnosyltransferase